MDLSLFLPVIIIFTEILLTFCSEAQSSSRVGRRSRPGSLDGRRGEMDDDLDIVDAELSVVIGRRRPTDNRRPGDRDMALASLEILVAGERTEQPTTTTEKTNHATRRPLPLCQNGGIRLLGSFCYCPPKFMGRYCEIYRYNSSCGRVPHGRWVYLNCNSCHCVAGVLKCQPHPMPGCDIKEEEQTTISLPDKLPDLDIILNDDDDDTHLVLAYNNSAPRRCYHTGTIISSLMAILLISQLLVRTPDR
ncbi:putative teratocarcinoma-derived growth factor 3 [Strongylocentrotus purpuratus]|uniref:EGF-like domain-containing protein n=1 Tax=Strongylocentrotus purpuratus TaxID=7668 RepID=A0A7M7RDY7_STRPU|nr:putative teratocarcinoma-derived growth factor 3 [Strongylocentrotus purpuratus]|eukprot:XP_787941.2 PREDICTED: putative teratocarcinoma-derived growth factor 3 [Strongylocentrotus purpuratus]